LGFSFVYENCAIVKSLAAQKYDIVLSDVQMPDMNGLELLRHIRTGKVAGPRNTRFVILTAFSNTEVLGAAMALDVNGFLAKPIRIGVVMEKIKKAVHETFQIQPPENYESVVTELSSLGAVQTTSELAKPAPLSVADKFETHGSVILVPLTRLREGMRTAKDVVATDGNIIIPAGTKLAQLALNRLSDLNSVLTEKVVHIIPH